MAEPRMRQRHKGSQFAREDLEAFLTAYGSPAPHLPETVRVLDEIVTDYIIEIAHEAALSASYSRRQKIKVEDFKFVLRKDPRKLGRVQELLTMEKQMRHERRQFNTDEGMKDLGKNADEDDEGNAGALGGGAGGPSKGKRTTEVGEPAPAKRGRKKKKVDF